MSWSSRQGGGKQFEIPKYDIHSELDQPRPYQRMNNMPPASLQSTANSIPPYMKISTVKVKKKSRYKRRSPPKDGRETLKSNKNRNNNNYNNNNNNNNECDEERISNVN